MLSLIFHHDYKKAHQVKKFSRNAMQLLNIFLFQDDFVQNHVVKNNMLKPIIDVFIANGNRYNLLNSAVLDLLEHIRKVLFFPFCLSSCGCYCI